jgi:hypothetical protein
MIRPTASEVLLTERARRSFTFESENPFYLDLNWPEENSFGEMRGLGAFRVDGALPVQLSWTVETDTVTTVRAIGDSAVTLSVCAIGGTIPSISVQALVCPPDDNDPLLSAMLGEHPLHWMHSLLHGAGLPAWALFAQEARVWPRQLDRILQCWREMPTGGESALWRCAGDERALNALLDWVYRLSEGMPAADIDAAVRVSLTADPGWAASPEAEWLEGCSGLPLAMLGSPVATDRLHAAGSLVLRLVKAGLDARRLNSLRQMAAAGMGQERLVPASVATLRQKRLNRRAAESLCRSIYFESQPLIESAAAGALGLLIEGAGRSWPLAEASFDLALPSAADAFQSALANNLPAFHNAGRGVCAQPGLLQLCATRPIGMRLSLPPLPQRKAGRILSALSEAEVFPAAGNRIEVRPCRTKPARLRLSDESLVQRLAMAPFRAASREPEDAAAEFACEDRFSISDRVPTILWRRLLDRYGLPWPTGDATARLRISVPSGWAEIWHELPHSRDETFPCVFSSIAATVQAALRHWLPHLALKTPSQYAEPLTAMPLLTYAASQPYLSPGKDAFTYDRFTAAGFQLALSSASSEFPGIIREVHRDLLASGHKSVRAYDPGRTQTMFGNVFRQRRLFSSLLAADALLVEEILHLADSASEFRAMTDSPRFTTKLLLRSIDSAESGLCRRIRRIYDGRSFDLILSVVLVEATAAACRAMGAQAEVGAVLTLERAGAREHFHNASALGRY